MHALVNDTGAKLSYRKGDEYQLEDFISLFRAPIISELTEETPGYYLEDIHKRQQTDKEIMQTKRSLKKGKKVHPEKFGNIKDRLIIHKGMIVIGGDKSGKPDVPLIPYNDSHELVVKTHTGILLEYM